MVATLVRLRFLILGNTLKGKPWQIVAVVIGGLYGLGVLFGVVAGLVALSFLPAELARTITVLGGAAAVLGWIVLPLIGPGTDQTVDPARLAIFPIPINQLVLALAVSGVLGVPGIVTSIAALATAATWWQHPLAAVAAIVCAVIGVFTCVVGSRAVTALSSGVGGGRRFREAKGILVFIPLILLGPIFIGLTALLRGSFDTLPSVADVVAWTPLGAIWSVPGYIATGDPLRAAAGFAIGIVTLALLAVLWRSSLRHALENPSRGSSPTKAGTRKLGFFSLFPATPWGAVASRALTYWIRDPRYAQSLIVIPLVPVFLFVYSGNFDNFGLLNALGPIVALLLALSIYTDVSYDNTAFALHLSTGVSGRDDRLGRVVALGVFAVPVSVMLTVGSVWFTNSWQVLPGLLGLVFGLLLSGLALSSVLSGRFAFPVPAPGENPFKAKPGGGFALMLSTFATWGGLMVLVLPETVLAVVGFVTGDAIWGWLALVVGLLLGSVLLVIGVRVGGAVLDRRGPELLVQLQGAK
ncbi:transporter [Agreia sp. COWG]|uniref:transporter n=1 Tax=Agreia sp. COWG TaxID=2773266 RepID=UPI001927D828|nr:transporter [Agreia sp. COWG]CAD6011494.1 ABC-2 type transport system permease protein [Agreia sp. COWG]